MSKLRGAAKAEFLARMARGRRKAARGNPKKKRGVQPSYKSKQSYIYGGLLTYSEDRGWFFDGHELGMRLTAAQAKKKAKAIANRQNPKDKSRNAGPGSVRKSKKAMKKFLPGFKRKKQNQEDSIEHAAEKFAEFHGKQPGRIIEYEQAIRYPENFAELGKLKELRFDLDSLNRDFPLSNFKDCQAVSTPDGSNIYFIGGDQRIDFEALNIATDKDFVELGPCTYISYHTVKGFHDFDPTDYWHRFGEENQIYPVLAYDRLNHTLFLIGGDYRVRPEGIVN